MPITINTSYLPLFSNRSEQLCELIQPTLQYLSQNHHCLAVGEFLKPRSFINNILEIEESMEEFFIFSF
jgi:hypothetical protein